MELLLVCFRIILNIIYFFLKLFPTSKNKITFLSRQDNNITLDMKLIRDELIKEKKNLKLVFLCKRFDNIKKHFISYSFYTLKTMYHVATSHVCIVDSYSLPISVLKHKKDLKVMQIWHAMGAIKKFGYQTVGKTSGRKVSVSKELKMHKNYDKIISGSSAMTKYFMEAFGYEKDSFLNYGLPRMDYLLNNEEILKKEILTKYKELSKKTNILYAPTFRTTFDDETDKLIENIDFNKYNLIVKSHKNQDIKLNNKSIYTCDEFSALELISVCDYLITDYSAIAIEAAILDKKTYYFVFDYDKYKENNGLNIDLYKEMPGCVFEDAKTLIKTLEKNNYDIDVLYKYKNKYVEVQDGTSTKKIVEYILKWVGE